MGDKGFLNRVSKSVFKKSSEPDKAPPSGKLEKENKRLRRAVEELSVLNDLALTVSTTQDPQEMVGKIVDRLMRVIKAEQATVTLFDTNIQNTAETEVRIMASSTALPQYHMNNAFIGWMELKKKPLVINDPRNDERFKGMQWDDTIRSVMCVPLTVKSQMIGAITVYNKKGEAGFTEEDERLLPVIAMQSAQIIDNTRLIKENAGMHEQMKLAYDIQKNLLPDKAPDIPGYDVAGTSIPAQTVGGDYFDYISMPTGNWAICLGDVTGKGLPASLLMANCQATLRGQTLVDASVSDRIMRSNKLMYQSTDVERFVTLFYGILDVTAHAMTFVSAGHEPGLVFSPSGDVKRLESGGLALGVIDDFPYKEDSVTFQPGDVMVIYSDGVPDATNVNDDDYGMDNLIALVQEHKNEPAVILVEKIVEAVNAHAGEAPQMDDVTIVVVRRNG